jgi:hypothetical protein
MQNDLSVQAASFVNMANGGVASVPPAVTTASSDVAVPTQTQSSSPNPTLQLNAALGLVVIEFRNDAGTVTSSIPSQQQLDAYRLWQTAGIGSPPNPGASDAGHASAPGPTATAATASAPAAMSATASASTRPAPALQSAPAPAPTSAPFAHFGGSQSSGPPSGSHSISA